MQRITPYQPTHQPTPHNGDNILPTGDVTTPPPPQ